MITGAGRIQIKRYLAGYEPAIGQSIAVGIGSQAESANNFKMHFEVDRADVVLTAYDFVGERLVFKGALPDTLAGTIYEVGLFSSAADLGAAQYGSKLLATFDSASEEWVRVGVGDTAYAAGNSRLGADSLRQSPTASTTVTDSLSNMFLDLSGHSAADTISLAYQNLDTNTSSIQLRFMTDASNYYQFTISNPAAGYSVTEMAKSSAVATGVPNWGAISEVRVSTIAKASGPAQVDFDGIRIEDVDSNSTGYILVAREVLPSPFVKEIGRTQEVEFSLAVSI